MFLQANPSVSVSNHLLPSRTAIGLHFNLWKMHLCRSRRQHECILLIVIPTGARLIYVMHAIKANVPFAVMLLSHGPTRHGSGFHMLHFSNFTEAFTLPSLANLKIN